jgi:superfamily I DNA and/or RNA helicase
MNEEIAEFPCNEFYDGKLQADESVKRRSLDDLLQSAPTNRAGILDFVLAKNPFLFLDTAGGGVIFADKTKKGATSKENDGEAKLVTEIAEGLLSWGIKPEDIAIISPYDAQVALIRRMLRVDGLEIKTVDGFQGREKEVVIVSFVRSNKSRVIGFLKDLRRLNVSITRAKRKLILIGDSTTLESEGCYKRLIEQAKDRAGYKKLA